MKSVRIYTSFLKKNNWDHKVFRDTETLREKWKEEIFSEPWELCIIHLGSSQPAYDAEQFVDLPAIKKKPVLLTESAKWGLLSPDSICSQSPVGSCKVPGKEQSCNLYFALDGWGYQIVEEKLLNSSSEDMSATNRKDWVKEFVERTPNFAINLEMASIYSEASYLKNKNHLDEESLIAAGNFRFLSYEKEVEQDLFEILEICPDWLLNCPLSCISLTLKFIDAFKRKNIVFIKDIQSYRAEDLNFDHNSSKDLAEAILFFFQEYKQNPNALADRADNISLNSYLEKSFRNLPRIGRQIIEARFGADGKKAPTLQALGGTLDKTRQRMQQLEKKYIISIIQEEWVDMIYKKINLLWRNRKEPLFLDMLPDEDEWFKGFTRREGYLKAIITHFSKHKVKVFPFEGRDIILPIDEKAFKTLIKELQTKVSSYPSSVCPKQEIENWVEDICEKNELATSKEIVWPSLVKNLHFATRPSGEEVLVGMGRSTDNLVSIVLEETEKPLTYSEIIERVSKIYDKKIDRRSIRNSLHRIPQVRLFDRGIYGLRRHFNIDKRQARKIIDQVEKSMNDGGKERQWHARELLKILFKTNKDLKDILNPWNIRIILEDSENIKYLRRQVWTLEPNTHRIQINKALISMLEKAGKPITEKELVDKLLESRGLKGDLQIHPSQILIKITPNTWGLSYRDLPFSQDKTDYYLKILLQYLKSKKKAVHVSEIQDILSRDEPNTTFDWNPHILLSFCVIDKRFKTWPNGWIGLLGWKSPSRH